MQIYKIHSVEIKTISEEDRKKHDGERKNEFNENCETLVKILSDFVVPLDCKKNVIKAFIRFLFKIDFLPNCYVGGPFSLKDGTKLRGFPDEDGQLINQKLSSLKTPDQQRIVDYFLKDAAFPPNKTNKDELVRYRESYLEKLVTKRSLTSTHRPEIFPDIPIENDPETLFNYILNKYDKFEENQKTQDNAKSLTSSEQPAEVEAGKKKNKTVDENENYDSLLNSLEIYQENDIDIVVKEPNKSSIPLNYKLMAFRSNHDKGWKKLCEILQDPKLIFAIHNQAEKKLMDRVCEKLIIGFNKVLSFKTPEKLALYQKHGNRPKEYQFIFKKGYDKKELESLKEEKLKQIGELAYKEKPGELLSNLTSEALALGASKKDVIDSLPDSYKENL